MIQRILTIPKIKVLNANALSSPITVGFPAMTAWLGAAHALERHLQAAGYDQFSIKSVGVVSNEYHLRVQTSENGYTKSIIGSRNPLKKDGKSPSFIEEPKCNLTVSIFMEYSGLEKDDEEAFKVSLTHLLNSKMRLAGGDILEFKAPFISKLNENSDDYTQSLRKLTRSVMPGYAILERRDLLLAEMENGHDALDGILEAVKTENYCAAEPPSEKNKDTNTEPKRLPWKQRRKHKGWIIPIATGFHGLTDIGTALNQRDPDTPHRFAEAIITLGEFKMPHKINNIDELLWQYHYDEENNLYTCIQKTNNN